jgi:hypothetical protein
MAVVAAEGLPRVQKMKGGKTTIFRKKIFLFFIFLNFVFHWSKLVGSYVYNVWYIPIARVVSICWQPNRQKITKQP